MATTKNPKGKDVKRAVLFKLTAEEKATKGEQAAKFSEDWKAVETKFKVVRTDFTDKLKSLRSKIDKLLGEIHEGQERREVECIEVKNFEENMVEFFHKGVKVDEREMTADDRQLEITPVKGKAKWQKANGKRFPTSSQEAKEMAEDKKAKEISEVIKLETKRGTKQSSVDGPRA